MRLNFLSVRPAGLVNIVTGEGPVVGDAIVRHRSIKRIAFTGSVPTGMAIQRSAAQVGIKHVTLELGGKNPLIAFADQDPEKMATVALQAMNFAWQGQSCGSASRLLLHEAIHDATQRWMGWTIGRLTSKQHGIPKGLPYLTGFVIHCEIVEEAMAD